MRRNHIRVLDIDGVQVVSHDAKAAALHGFYTALLGRAREPRWEFDLAALYAGARLVDQAALAARFELAEIKDAIDGMDRASAPGPDGLGPSFYQAAWTSVAPDVVRLFDDFHAGSVDLGSINRAFIVLLPKKDGILPPGSYRPVSLQNCSMKMVCKALTSRLQAQIDGLIDPDQSGFITGRSISENFVYATEVIQCCHKRRAPAFALKLNFAKAFDSINWDSLREILRVCGFPEKWCGWMQAIFDSSRSAVVLNGIPGRWINCRRGFCQGDTLSPYLFLLVADVLQRMIQQDGVLEHPLCDGMPLVVLQYTDDTLVLFRANAAAARHLKNVLDMFAVATGLVINFHKSTLVSMHVDSVMVDEVRGVLGCTLESFPQNYLGLPLSCEKLSAATFAPLIAKADRYLSGWRAVLLSAGGRIVLVNAVLDALPTYVMAALPLHPAVVKKLDALRRAFLWDATERVSGAQCLVA
jgi:hypothetical protein